MDERLLGDSAPRPRPAAMEERESLGIAPRIPETFFALQLSLRRRSTAKMRGDHGDAIRADQSSNVAT